MQIVSQIIYKLGSTSPKYWIIGFVAGNIIGVSSMWFLMKLYARINPGLAMGFGLGGAFLFSQITFAIVFGYKMGYNQIFAYIFITVGMLLAGAESLDLSS